MKTYTVRDSQDHVHTVVALKMQNYSDAVTFHGDETDSLRLVAKFTNPISAVETTETKPKFPPYTSNYVADVSFRINGNERDVQRAIEKMVREHGWVTDGLSITQTFTPSYVR
jgi:hypothetical protein